MGIQAKHSDTGFLLGQLCWLWKIPIVKDST